MYSSFHFFGKELLFVVLEMGLQVSAQMLLLTQQLAKVSVLPLLFLCELKGVHSMTLIRALVLTFAQSRILAFLPTVLVLASPAILLTRVLSFPQLVARIFVLAELKLVSSFHSSLSLTPLVWHLHNVLVSFQGYVLMHLLEHASSLCRTSVALLVLYRYFALDRASVAPRLVHGTCESLLQPQHVGG